MDRIEELLQKMVRVGNAGEITIRAERHRATFEQGYTDPKEALECYQELKRNRWVLTELRIEYMPPRRSVIQEITDKKIGRIIDDFEARMRRERESKKMLNFDKYRDVILSHGPDEVTCHDIAALRGRPEKCNGIFCGECNSNNYKWLFSEYKPPLLQNGDSLKPGDEIMVRHYAKDAWKKRVFMCYYAGMFYVTTDMATAANMKTCEVFTQARLPKEGE